MNALKNQWTGKWAAIFTAFSLLAAFSADAITPTATVTVQVVGGGTVSPNYNGQTLTTGKQYSLTAKAKGGFAFTGWSGSLSSSSAKLTFVLSSDLALTATFVDKQKPTVSISPVPKSWKTNSVGNSIYVVTGKAKDNGMIAQVYCSVNGGSWQSASTGNNWTNWWFDATLAPNTNTVLAYAVDTAGNISKTNKLKVIYSAAEPNFYNPNKYTMLVYNEGNLVEEATYWTNTFSDVTGVGTYTYKKTGPVTGKLIMKYTAPPSAVNVTNNVNVTLLYDSPLSGTFTDADGINTFTLVGTYNWSPTALVDSAITLTDSDGVSQRVLDFPQQPSVGGNASATHDPNPLVIALNSTYPGQIGDRVKVTFAHTRKMNGVVKTLSNPVDVGTVIDADANNNTVKVLFDSPSFAKSEDPFQPTAMSIVSFYYQDYSSGSFVTNGTGTFTYTNYSFVGSLLQLNLDGQNKSMILTFTNDSSAGIYFDETHYPDTTVSTDYGSFELAMAPLITAQPQDFAGTNGGSANFSVTVSGTPTLVYQWLFEGTNLTDGATGSGSTISGSQTASLTIDNISSSDFGNYQVIITNDFGSVTSSIASLALAVAPHIISQPQDATITSGQTASFSVSAAGSAPLGYRWQGNGTNLVDGTTGWSSVIQGSKTANLTISSATPNDSGVYQVIITNSFGSVTSSVANLNVN